MVGIIVLIVIIAIGIIGWRMLDRETVINEDVINVTIEEGEELPLQDKTYRLQNRYNNIAQNQRTDAVIDLLHKIHFWVAIIGIYYLLKIIVNISSFFTLISLGNELSEILQSIF